MVKMLFTQLILSFTAVESSSNLEVVRICVCMIALHVEVLIILGNYQNVLAAKSLYFIYKKKKANKYYRVIKNHVVDERVQEHNENV